VSVAYVKLLFKHVYGRTEVNQQIPQTVQWIPALTT